MQKTSAFNLLPFPQQQWGFDLNTAPLELKINEFPEIEALFNTLRIRYFRTPGRMTDWEALSMFLFRYPAYLGYSISKNFTTVVLDTLTLMKFSAAIMSRQLAQLRMYGLTGPRFSEYVHDYIASNLQHIKQMKYFPNLYLWFSKLRQSTVIRRACYSHLHSLSDKGEFSRMEISELLNWFTIAAQAYDKK